MCVQQVLHFAAYFLSGSIIPLFTISMRILTILPDYSLHFQGFSTMPNSAGLSRTIPDNTPCPALSALIILAHYHGIAANPADIQHEFCVSAQSDLNETQWLLAAKKLELKAKVVRQPVKRLAMATLPALVWCDDGNHFILAKTDGEGENTQYLIQDLTTNKSAVLSFSEFSNRYSGKLILVASRASVLGSLAKFDFTWFIPAVIKYRRLFF